jgi:hypothetical protein
MLAFRKIAFLFVSFLLFANFCEAQGQTDNSPVYVESWTVGNKIREQVLKFNLDSSQNPNPEYIRDYGAGLYKLTLIRVPARESKYDLEHWAVQLQRVLSEPNKKEKLTCNLLRAEGCGGGGDNFPKEDCVAVLFPAEAPKNSVEKVFFGRYYPVSAKRIIKVEDFYVLIQVKSYKMNETNSKKLDSMEVTIEFKNEYRPDKVCE